MIAMQLYEKPVLGLVGTFIDDEIIPLHGARVRSIGGLYHALAYTALLADGRYVVRPVARVGRRFFPVLRRALERLPGVDTSCLHECEAENTRVTLKYTSHDERQECTTAPMAPLAIDELRSLPPAAGILVNMITGEDISLAALRWLARVKSGLLYLDIHSKSLGIDAAGYRYPRRPADWQAWLAAADILQLNQNEAALFSGAPAGRSIIGFHGFIETTLQAGPRGILITLGQEGVLAAARDHTGRIEIQHFKSAIDQEQVIDVIGCGDAFGAAFLVYYLSASGDFFAAAEFATRIATLNTTFMGSLTTQIFAEKIKQHANFEK